MTIQLDVGKPIWRVTGKCRGRSVTAYVNAADGAAAAAAAKLRGIEGVAQSHAIVLGESDETWPEHLGHCDACAKDGNVPCPEGAAAHVRTLAASLKLPRSPSLSSAVE